MENNEEDVPMPVEEEYDNDNEEGNMNQQEEMEDEDEEREEGFDKGIELDEEGSKEVIQEEKEREEYEEEAEGLEDEEYGDADENGDEEEYTQLEPPRNITKNIKGDLRKYHFLKTVKSLEEMDKLRFEVKKKNIILKCQNFIRIIAISFAANHRKFRDHT
jgi:hypothetical protein